MIMDAEKILESLPRFNFLQISVILSVGYLCFRAPWQIFGITFIATPPENFTCSVPFNQSDLYVSEQCSLTNIQANKSSECSQWDYYDIPEKHSIASDWDLVCSSSYLVTLEQTIYIVGQAVGALFLTPLSDKFGRRNAILVSMLVHFLLAIALMFSVDIFMFLPIRFVMGSANQVIVTTSFVLMAEYASIKHRTLMTNSIMVFWALGIVTMAGIAYLLRNWRSLVFAYSVLTNLLVFVFYFTLPESFFFMIANGRYAQVEQTLKKVKFPKTITLEQEKTLQMVKRASQIDMTAQKKMQQEASGSMKQAAKDILKSPTMLMITIGLFLLSLSLNFTYYIATMMTGQLSGDPYVNFALSGLVEVPFILAAMVLCVFVPRTILLASLYFIAFVALTAYSFTKLTVIAYFGRGAVSGAYIVQVLYTTELYPTAVRNAGLGFYQVAENLGPAIANPVSVLPWGSTGFTSFYFFLGILSAANAALVSLMPETRGYVLPDTVKEIEDRHSFAFWHYVLCLDKKKASKKKTKGLEVYDEKTQPIEIEMINEF